MSVQEKMIALADQIRILSGQGQRMGLDTMAARMAEANDQVAEQTELIGQIRAALQDFEGGGTGSPFGSSALGELYPALQGTAQSDMQVQQETAAAKV